MNIQVGFVAFWPFLDDERLRLILRENILQDYSAGLHSCSPNLFLLYVNDLSDDVICNIDYYADDTFLHSKCSGIWFVAKA